MTESAHSESHWSLRRRLARFLSGLVVMMLALVMLAVVLLVQVRHDQQQVIDRYFSAVSLSSQRFVAQVDAETGVRGYALTRDPATLQPTQTFLSASYQEQLGQLHALLHGDTRADADLTIWQQATTDWYQQWALPTVAKIRSGGRLTTAGVIAGKALFDKNRSAYAAYTSAVTSKRTAASSALKLRTNLLFAAVLLATFGMAVAGVALWFALRRWVIGPLSDLGAETRLVTSGALDHRVEVSGPREIVTLGNDVEGMRRDIVRQLAEVELARQEIDAARRVLESQAEDLARSNRDLEQFAYVASHDLQEPLRKVASFCQMLDRRYSGQLDERADQYIAFAVDGAKRMQQLINDLLAFSRVGRMSEGLVDVDVQAVFKTALQNLAASIETNEARVTADPLPHVAGERGLLVQLFQNLIGNAIKFRSGAEPVVRIRAVARGEFWEFSCSDNGIGIEPQYAERIFVIFQRLHAKDEYGGTGIGLALCKRIIEHHGGQIWLDTEATVGTTFRWTLKATTTSSEHTEPDVRERSLSG